MKVDFRGTFQCQQCGACCQTSGWVYITACEGQRVAHFLKIDPVLFFRNFTIREDGWLLLSSPEFKPHCFLQDGVHCTIYPARPRTCRVYPMIFSDVEEYQAALTICPELRRLVKTNPEAQE
ncbi:YkgJ family cysteine cluster protein [candidate division CSSED10-310 bacterium]|uniref:YkgJ family cysteine cluster protein n=1 Tax=candidate division CSSED10-310 bacterium TaxID=2855610 RepID=A0ABV6YRK1_UNCC1